MDNKRIKVDTNRHIVKLTPQFDSFEYFSPRRRAQFRLILQKHLTYIMCSC